MKLKNLEYFVKLYPDHEIDIALEPRRFIIKGISFEDDDQRSRDKITIFDNGRFEIETFTEYYDCLGEIEFGKVNRWSGKIEDGEIKYLDES